MKLWPWSKIHQLEQDLDQANDIIDQAEDAITELWIANMRHTALAQAEFGMTDEPKAETLN